MSLKKFKIESENLMEKRLRIMNPVLIEVPVVDQLFKTEYQSIHESAQSFPNIERIDQTLLDFSGIEEYKATVLPTLETKMGEVKDYEDLGTNDKRFASINVSSIDHSQVSAFSSAPRKDPQVPTVEQPQKPYGTPPSPSRPATRSELAGLRRERTRAR